VTNYDYTGGQQTFTPTVSGYFKLEVWGAAGGKGIASTNIDGAHGGYGGYSIGVSKINAGSTLYIHTGGAGATLSCTSTGCAAAGGYNGGGGIPYSANNDGASGGGATHIATVAGLLKNLSTYKDTGGTNVSKEILIVAGGGGGEGSTGGGSGSTAVYGGNGGGFSGQKGYSVWGSSCGLNVSSGDGGTQTAGGATYNTCATYHQPHMNSTAGSFGQGGQSGSTSGSDTGASGGGGGGWYGGGGGFILSGGGGSGYIGSSNLISSSSITKHMTCYSCTTSTAAATRTNSNTNAATSAATADRAKLGNGYARITYLGTSI
jgi:hypothetical protein